MYTSGINSTTIIFEIILGVLTPQTIIFEFILGLSTAQTIILYKNVAVSPTVLDIDIDIVGRSWQPTLLLTIDEKNIQQLTRRKIAHGDKHCRDCFQHSIVSSHTHQWEHCAVNATCSAAIRTSCESTRSIMTNKYFSYKFRRSIMTNKYFMEILLYQQHNKLY